MTISPATALIDRLVAEHGKKNAHRLLDAILDQVPVVDLAALAYDWRQFWARPKQIIPAGEWRSFGFLTGRGVGKTTAIAFDLVEQIQAGNVKAIGLAAQNEEKTIAVQVAALIDASPPWFRPEWRAGVKELHWPNGAWAIVYTPEVPGAIRGKNLDVCWLSEIQSWPKVTMAEAFMNFAATTRIGVARMYWDATPKRRHPILRALLERHESELGVHIVVRGSIHENARNLAKGVISDLEKQLGNTQQGREELLGEMLDDVDGAMIRQKWIDDARNHAPSAYVRRVIAIDPAVTSRAGNDKTGIIDAGLDISGQAYVLGDHSGRHKPDEWAKVVIERYLAGSCDCVVVETNKGGDLVTQVLRAQAGKRGISVEVLPKDKPPPRHNATKIYVREVHARGAKEDRAQPLATAYEQGRVSHATGVDLTELEDLITTWEPAPGQRSPDALDALVHGIVELLGLLAAPKVDHRAAMKGLPAVTQALLGPSMPRQGLSPAIVSLIGSGSGKI